MLLRNVGNTFKLSLENKNNLQYQEEEDWNVLKGRPISSWVDIWPGQSWLTILLNPNWRARTWYTTNCSNARKRSHLETVTPGVENGALGTWSWASKSPMCAIKAVTDWRAATSLEINVALAAPNYRCSIPEASKDVHSSWNKTSTAVKISSWFIQWSSKLANLASRPVSLWTKFWSNSRTVVEETEQARVKDIGNDRDLTVVFRENLHLGFNTKTS